MNYLHAGDFGRLRGIICVRYAAAGGSSILQNTAKFFVANPKRLADVPKVAREELTSVIAVSREPSAAVAMAGASTCEWVVLITVILVADAVGLASPILVAVSP